VSRLATVLVPTHDHGPLLAHSVGSALGQSVADIEVLIVGDGVDDATREVAHELEARDERVRFFDNDKGPRHGEILRHAALQQASGGIVCYLADDDLWLPDHVASMLDLLDGADFGHALPVGIRIDGSLFLWAGDLGVPVSRRRVVAFDNFIPLSCGAHTMELYRRLPFGWRTTPDPIATDVYMWSQILSEPGCVARSGARPTVVHFPSPWRAEMTETERRDELAIWQDRISEPAFEERFTATVLEAMSRERTGAVEKFRALEKRIDSLQGQLLDSQGRLQAAHGRLQDRDARLAEVRAQLDEQRSLLDENRERLRVTGERLEAGKRQIARMTGSVTWRTRDLLLRVPGVAPIARWAGAARSRRAAG
jgi:hypothetical protein